MSGEEVAARVRALCDEWDPRNLGCGVPGNLIRAVLDDTTSEVASLLARWESAPVDGMVAWSTVANILRATLAAEPTP